MQTEHFHDQQWSCDELQLRPQFPAENGKQQVWNSEAESNTGSGMTCDHIPELDFANRSMRRKEQRGTIFGLWAEIWIGEDDQ